MKHIIFNGLTFRLGRLAITMDAVLLLLAPFTLWATAAIYVPIEGSGFTTAESWAIAAVILIFMLISLFLHSLAHETIFGNREKNEPLRIHLGPLGDPAQSHPTVPGPGRETLNALAGPLMQCLLAAVFYLLWNLQINAFISAAAAFLIFFNLGLAAINLTPVFPFDGGRILRAISWKLLGQPAKATRLAGRGGWGFCILLAAWSIFLIVPQDRFSLPTAGATLFAGALTAISLLCNKTRPWDKTDTGVQLSKNTRVWRTGAAVLLALPLAAVALSLLPLNQGLEAPGFTASVEPMVQIPDEYRHESAGRLILVTVIPQAPIIAGEWVYAHIDRSIKLTPAEQIVPEDKTPQSVAADNYRMLMDSETTAIIAGIRLAGYTAEVENAGVRILSVSPEFPSSAVLQPGDIITGVDGSPVTTPAELTDRIKLLTEASKLQMDIMRGGEALLLEVPTMEAAEAGTGVKIGIMIEQYSTGYKLPFPVEITAEKVSGGPSAGLMFTLAVYDLLTKNDLTGGRKIAGTGTIDLNGNVGAIGGVQQKVVAAERAGAAYFLVPEDNYADALAAANRIEVIKVTTAREAIDILTSGINGQ